MRCHRRASRRKSAPDSVTEPRNDSISSARPDDGRARGEASVQGGLPSAGAVALAHLPLHLAGRLFEPAPGALPGAGRLARGHPRRSPNLFGRSPGDIARACFHDTLSLVGK